MDRPRAMAQRLKRAACGFSIQRHKAVAAGRFKAPHHPGMVRFGEAVPAARQPRLGVVGPRNDHDAPRGVVNAVDDDQAIAPLGKPKGLCQAQTQLVLQGLSAFAMHRNARRFQQHGVVRIEVQDGR